jgi:xanthine dehydrogenase accessory factor
MLRSPWYIPVQRKSKEQQSFVKDIYSEITENLQKKEQVVLATIVSSSGSSPLPSGSMMLVKCGGEEIIGSVGGGLLEALVIEDAKKYFREARMPHVGTFDLNDDVSNEGMICGGSVDVLLEPISNDDFVVFKQLVELRNDGSDCVLVRLLGISKKISRFILLSKQTALPEEIKAALGPDAGLVDAFRHAFGQEDVRRVKIEQGEIIIQPIRGLQNLIIFGGGHVSKYLAQIAMVAGFSTTVIDDREEFADPERFPGAVRVFTSEYAKAFSKIEVKPSTYIVIVTRGHKSDQAVLEEAVQTPARYIGMIGSKRKVIACFEDLVHRGVPLADLKRVHAPIGLDIGAVTAEEIAVSITSEMIRVRRGFNVPSSSIAEGVKQWFDKQERP